MMDTYERAQAQYRSTGNAQLKPAADLAKKAIEDYIANLESTARAGATRFAEYTRSQSSTPQEIERIVEIGRTVRDKSKEVANDFIVANDFNQPMPIDWTKYYIKLGVLAGLAGGIAVVALTR